MGMEKLYDTPCEIPQEYEMVVSRKKPVTIPHKIDRAETEVSKELTLEETEVSRKLIGTEEPNMYDTPSCDIPQEYEMVVSRKKPSVSGVNHTLPHNCKFDRAQTEVSKARVETKKLALAAAVAVMSLVSMLAICSLAIAIVTYLNTRAAGDGDTLLAQSETITSDIMADVHAQILKLSQELNLTQSQLNITQSKLNVTWSQLNLTQSQLNITRSQLNETTRRLSNVRTPGKGNYY